MRKPWGSHGDESHGAIFLVLCRRKVRYNRQRLCLRKSPSSGLKLRIRLRHLNLRCSQRSRARGLLQRFRPRECRGILRILAAHPPPVRLRVTPPFPHLRLPVGPHHHPARLLPVRRDRIPVRRLPHRPRPAGACRIRPDRRKR